MSAFLPVGRGGRDAGTGARGRARSGGRHHVRADEAPVQTYLAVLFCTRKISEHLSSNPLLKAVLLSLSDFFFFFSSFYTLRGGNGKKQKQNSKQRGGLASRARKRWGGGGQQGGAKKEFFFPSPLCRKQFGFSFLPSPLFPLPPRPLFLHLLLSPRPLSSLPRLTKRTWLRSARSRTPRRPHPSPSQAPPPSRAERARRSSP